MTSVLTSPVTNEKRADMTPSRNARIVAVANHKGGVGKTTTTIGLAHAAADAGLRVLVIDNDGQGNSTTALTGITRGTESDKYTLAEVYDREIRGELADTIIPTRRDGIDIAPSGFDQMDPVLQTLAARIAPQQVLGRGVEKVRHLYDWILIDCPPAMGYATINALVASDVVLVLSEPSTFGHMGLSKIIDAVDEINEELRGDRPIPDPIILVNNVDARATRADGASVAAIRDWAEQAELQVCSDVIPRRSIIKTMAQSGLNLSEANDATARHVSTVYSSVLDVLEEKQ